MNEVGMNGLRNWAMTERQHHRSPTDESLTEIERRLFGRLRAHRLSSQLINRHLEDAVQKGVVEWLRVQSEGTEVRDPEAFVAEAAFRRAIDEVRREARRADGAALDAMLEMGRHSSASAEEVAIQNLESERLQAAIDSLPVEERQVLNLHYFDELDQRGAATRLHMSERTYRRRLRQTLSELAAVLGAPAPEPRTPRGFAIGLAAWTGLSGGRLAAPATGRLGTLVTSVIRTPAKITSRLRGPGTRILASETSEQMGAIASGPAGKVIGGCAGAMIVCALAGFALHTGPHHRTGSPPAARQRSRIQDTSNEVNPPHEPSAAAPLIRPRVSRTPAQTSRPSLARNQKAKGASSDGQGTPKRRRENRETETQFSGVVKAGLEAESSDPPTATTIPPEAATPPSPPPEVEPTATSEEQQVERQFRGPLAR